MRQVKRFAGTASRLATVLAVVASCVVRQGQAFEPVRPAPEQVERYGQFEIAFVPDRPPADPWRTSPDELAARFTCPSGRTVWVPAFYTQDYEARVEAASAARKSVQSLKIYLPRADWPGARRLAVYFDDVRLVDSSSGAQKLVGGFERGLDGWTAVSCAGSVSPGRAAEGNKSMRIDVDFGPGVSWPGINLDAGGADWSSYDQLRFRVYLESGRPSGPVRVEYYTSDGRKIQAGPELRGMAKQGQWTEVVWDWSSMPDHVRLEATGQPRYAVRFMPRELGRHRFELLQRGKVVEAGEFECVASTLPPPLRISADRAHFEHEDGTPYLAIGENVCWYGKGGIKDYDRWLGRLAKAGANYCRIWMPPWAFAIEWEKLGAYRLDRAWELDYVLSLAQRLGISVMLCLDYHGAFRTQNGTWAQNPYNAANGGPCEKPRDFFTSPPAQQAYQQRLRYVVARYGSYSNLLAWELFNEVNLVDGYDGPSVATWHARMGRYLRTIDPYGHLVTTSFGGPAGDPAIWKLPEIDYVQSHEYAGTDWVETPRFWVNAHRNAYGKPMLFGEFGLHWRGGSQDRDPAGVHLHNGIWSAVMSGSAGTAMTWWWDSYVDPCDLYHHFRSLSAFASDIDWTQGFRPLSSCTLTFAGGGPRKTRGAVCLRSENVRWEPAPFNKPCTLHVDATGHLEQPDLLSGLLHGTGNHPDLHNPQTFVIDFPSEGEFRVLVNGVSGHGGANLNVLIDGTSARSEQFPDDDPSTQTLHQFDRSYGVPVPPGKHRITVDNDGKDWVRVSYVIVNLWERRRPNARVLGLTGPQDTLVWLPNAEFTWDRVARLGLEPAPIQDAELTLPGLAPGEYDLTVWDTWRGVEISHKKWRADSARTVHLPTFREAIAVRLHRLTGPRGH